MKLNQEYRVIQKEWDLYLDQLGVERNGWRVLDFDTIYVDEIELSGNSDGYGGETIYIYATSMTTKRRFRGRIDPTSMGPPVPVWIWNGLSYFPYSKHQKNLFLGPKEYPKPFIWEE